MSEADSSKHTLAQGDTPDAGLELRVLTGLHIGARALLAGQSEFTIGSDPENDLILRDAPFESARIVLGGARWTWIEDDPAVEVLLACGQALRVGDLLFMLDEPGAAWVGAEQARVGFERPAASGAPREPATPASEQTHSGLGQPAQDASSLEAGGGLGPSRPADGSASSGSVGRSAQLRGEPKRQLSRFFGRPSVLVPGAAMVAIAVAAWTLGADPWHRWLGEREPASPPVQTAPAADQAPARADESDLERVNLAISTSGFADVVRASIRSDGRILVQGVVESDEDQELLLRSLLVERKWLAFGLLTQAEFRARVRELRRTLPPGFEIKELPEGRIDLSGLALEAGDIEQVRALVMRELPETTAVLVNVLTPDLAVARFSSLLRELGFETVRVNWTGERMVVEGSIPRPSMALWEQSLLRFNSLFGDRLPTRVALSLSDPAPALAVAAPVAAAARTPPPPKLPRIVAVQSGARAYLMFADGNRLLPGGVVNGYRLASIEDESLLFEDKTGYQHRVAR